MAAPAARLPENALITNDKKGRCFIKKLSAFFVLGKVSQNYPIIKFTLICKPLVVGIPINPPCYRNYLVSTFPDF